MCGMEVEISKKQYKINWSILSRASSIKAGGNNCSLCLEEKLQILGIVINSRSVLNKRSELFHEMRGARADSARDDSNEHASANIYIASSIT